jgi:hypothetical protein
MGLADLIQRKKTSIVLSSATAIPAIPAIVEYITADIPPRIATIATIAVAAHETELDLWRWFLLEADQIYKSAPKSADSWNIHKQHRKAAGDHCTAGNIPAARVEFEKALTALQGVALTQHKLF